MKKVTFNFHKKVSTRDYQRRKCYRAETACGTWSGDKDFDLTLAQCKTFFEYLRMRYMPAHLGKDCSLEFSKKLKYAQAKFTYWKELKNQGINPPIHYACKLKDIGFFWANDKAIIVIGKNAKRTNVVLHEFAHAIEMVYLPEFAQWCLDNDLDKFNSIDWSSHGKVFTHVLAELMREHNGYFDANKFSAMTDGDDNIKNKNKILTAKCFVDWLFYSHHKLISNNPVPRWDAKNTKNHGRVYRGKVQACLNDDQLPNIEQYKSTPKPKEPEASNVFQLVSNNQLSLLLEVA